MRNYLTDNPSNLGKYVTVDSFLASDLLYLRSVGTVSDMPGHRATAFAAARDSSFPHWSRPNDARLSEPKTQSGPVSVDT